ncbi:MAG: YbaK/EbsC family protein [Acidimicrobiia bacterium]
MPADPRVIADLESASIEYEEMACDPELADTAAFCEAYGIPLERSANAIVVASRKPEGRNAVCVVLATDRLDVNGVVRHRLGVRKVSFASAQLTQELTGQEIGGVTIFGLPDDLPVWIDSRVVENDWVVVGAGSRSAKIRFDPSQIVGKDLYEVVEGLAKISESG